MLVRSSVPFDQRVRPSKYPLSATKNNTHEQAWLSLHLAASRIYLNKNEQQCCGGGGASGGRRAGHLLRRHHKSAAQRRPAPPPADGLPISARVIGHPCGHCLACRNTLFDGHKQRSTSTPSRVYGMKWTFSRLSIDLAASLAVVSAKNHKRQRRKRQSITAKREKSQTPNRNTNLT